MTVTCSLALLVSLAALLLLPPEVAGACSSPPPGAASVSRAPARTKSRGRKARSRTGTAPDRLEDRAVPTAFTWPIRTPTTRLLAPDAEGGGCGATGTIGPLGLVGAVGPFAPPSVPPFWPPF